MQSIGQRNDFNSIDVIGLINERLDLIWIGVVSRWTAMNWANEVGLIMQIRGWWRGVTWPDGGADFAHRPRAQVTEDVFVPQEQKGILRQGEGTISISGNFYLQNPARIPEGWGWDPPEKNLRASARVTQPLA